MEIVLLILIIFTWSCSAILAAGSYKKLLLIYKENKKLLIFHCILALGLFIASLYCVPRIFDTNFIIPYLFIR
jgi:cytochrome c oxidase assembly factor CtaG